MKSLIPVLFLALCFTACGPEALLDRPFNPEKYKVDLTRLLKDTSISNADALLINYAVIRNRPYYNYSIQGKTYGEILHMAKGFKEKGLPIEEIFEPVAEKQELLSLKVFNEGSGLVRKKGSKSRLKKMLNFSCEYTNTSDQDVVLSNSTFQIRGPLKDHILTVAYEINCLITAGNKLEVLFIADPALIKRNLFYDKKIESSYLGMEELLLMLDIEESGTSVTTNTTFFKECFFENARMAPFEEVRYNKEENSLGYFNPQPAGTSYQIHLGKALIEPQENEEPVTIYER